MALLLGARSTKAGARTPATQVVPEQPAERLGPLNEGRGANPGDTRPGGWRPACAATLNEGRGANPGDTPTLRSRTAVTRSLNEGRGANPGDTPRPRSAR